MYYCYWIWGRVDTPLRFVAHSDGSSLLLDIFHQTTFTLLYRVSCWACRSPYLGKVSGASSEHTGPMLNLGAIISAPFLLKPARTNKSP
jgi:hypothetical protein